MSVRFDWTMAEIEELYSLPLFKLISRAHQCHVANHEVGEVQVCSLISFKTGGCTEDCKYCAQSSRYETNIKAQPMMKYDEVIAMARQAKARGATRVCLGAAWREVKDNKQFDETLKIVKGVAELGVEVCCTLGMLNENQAAKLKEAGVYAYNHNLDSSEKFYKTIITTRSYQERLQTLDIVEKSGMTVCCGGIIGMGETVEDRLELLFNLCTRNPHPESVPINRLSAIPGTPLEHQHKISHWEHIRLIAVARLLMPKAMIRLSAGRIEMSEESQALCFFAGANSIFAGEKLLTVANTALDSDEKMFETLGLSKRPAFAHDAK